MKRKKRFAFGLFIALLLFSTTVALAASLFFLEPEVDVLYSVDGDGGAGSFGWVAAALGDLNGDAAPETIVTAPFLAGASPFEGKIYIYDGASGALLHDQRGSGFSLFGHSATVAGDVNGDGIPDYVVGAPGLDAFGVPFGTVGQAIVYSGADHSVILTISGAAGTAFGASVSGAGDVNEDGQADILVGSTYASSLAANGGNLSLYSGADGSLIWSVDGIYENGFLGSGVGELGDVSGDGVPDVVAGAQGAGSKGRGEAYAFSGTDGSALYTMKPVGLPGQTPTFGQYHASAAPDVNGDGVTDIYIGDYNARRGQSQGNNAVVRTGRSYIFSGVDGARLYVFDAENNGDGLGPGRGIGDVNGDGFGDIFTASYQYSESAINAGKGYVYSGQDGTVLRTMTGSTANIYLGVDALAIGDVNGDGYTDYMLTGFGVVHVIAGTPLD